MKSVVQCLPCATASLRELIWFRLRARPEAGLGSSVFINGSICPMSGEPQGLMPILPLILSPLFAVERQELAWRKHLDPLTSFRGNSSGLRRYPGRKAVSFPPSCHWPNATNAGVWRGAPRGR